MRRNAAPRSATEARRATDADVNDMSGAEGSVETRIGQVVGERFGIRRLVASGGMANVYEAEDLGTGRVGALKLLRSHFRDAADAIERLTREASAATRLSDPHIVQTLDAGKLASGEPYVFMELLTGQPLDRLLERRGRLPIGEALDIARQAAQGLCAAHAAGVLHRDIKPANLVLSSGNLPAVKLLDFGVSKLPDQLALTREGFALGTFSYMPPEQMLSAKRVDGRADLYSLGVVLYQCLAGRLPFVARNLHALMALMEKNEYVPVSRVRPDAPPEVDAIVERTVRADPNERYGTASELRDALARLCRKSLPFRMLSVGGETPAQTAPLPTTLPQSPSVPARPAPPMEPERAEPMTVAAVAPRAGSLLIETIVPKTHRSS
jgi:eukaryotic-like serine/threonine-protein kinase